VNNGVVTHHKQPGGNKHDVPLSPRPKEVRGDAGGGGGDEDRRGRGRLKAPRGGAGSEPVGGGGVRRKKRKALQVCARLPGQQYGANLL
jgi:hypothetical protein